MLSIVEQLRLIAGDYIDYLGVARIKRKMNRRGAEDTEEEKFDKVFTIVM
jgi:hypothetical protein